MLCDSPSEWLVVAKPPVWQQAAMYRREFASRRRGPGLMHLTILSLGPLADLGCDETVLASALDGIEADPFLFVLAYAQARMGGTAELVAARTPPAARRLRLAVMARLQSRGIPVSGKGGTRPHVTLNYTWRWPGLRQAIEPIPWLIDEIQLIESLTGRGEHKLHGRFPIAPRQGMLFPLTRCAAA